MEDFFGIPAEQIYDNRLYRGLDKLLPLKDGLQQHLGVSKRFHRKNDGVMCMADPVSNPQGG
jgi:hypothetical protein